MKWFSRSAVVTLLFSTLLCPAAVRAQDSAADSGEEAPRIIIFTSARWHYVTMLKEKYGTYVYAKPGGYPIAVTEYEFDKKRTLEVNGALQDLVAICRGEAVDPSRVFALKTRSKKIFGEVVREKLQACYQQLRNRQEQARLRALEQQPDTKLSDIADDVSIENGGEGSGAVISNETVGHGDAAFSVSGQNMGAEFDHQQEYLKQAKKIIEIECMNEWSKDRKMFYQCVAEERKAVEKLAARPTTTAPIEIFRHVREGCRRQWPKDYGMRDECEVEEFRCYWSIEQKMADAEIPYSEFHEFKAVCSGKWPDNYRLQEECLDEMIGTYQASTE